MMPVYQGLNPHELAHRWVKDFGTRPDMSIKVGCQSHDMRILGRIVGVRSTEQSVGIKIVSFSILHIFRQLCRIVGVRSTEQSVGIKKDLPGVTVTAGEVSGS